MADLVIRGAQLVDGTGAYEPYFRMVKAIEGQSLDDLKEAADGLFMSPDAINVAVLHAMANATSLD